MNKYKIYSKLFFVPLIISLLTMMVVTGCSDDDDELQTSTYGYVQFKLYKSASFNKGEATRAMTDKIETLSDARKVRVVMLYNGSTISQTLNLNSYNAENAEFGLRSDKLQLVAGNYTIIGFYLYDRLDKEFYAGMPENGDSFTIVGGGLQTQALTVDAVERGMVSFKLVKEFVKTRALAKDPYPLANIRFIDITVKNLFTQELTQIKKIRVKYKEGFHDGSANSDLYPDDNAETSYSECDTIVWMKAGSYQISSYTTYSDRNAKVMLETAVGDPSKTFVVKDNEQTKDVEVPVRLAETDEYIKDYIALKAIWEKLGGKNWKYSGEAYPVGVNWNFNKDIDMWGDQPGVSLDSNGHVVSLSLAGFGPSGVVPDEIGQLTELRILSLGTHAERLGGRLFSDIKGIPTEAQKKAIRYDYEEKFLARDVREGLSDILQEGINTDSSQKPIKKSKLATLADVQAGKYTNNITGISKAMMRLVKLEQFYIANSPIESATFFRDIAADSPYQDEQAEWSWNNLNQLIDIEIYNCPKLTEWPEMLNHLPELQSLNIASNTGIQSTAMLDGWKAFIDGDSGAKIQVLYMGYNHLKEFPEYEFLSKMEKLVLLDCIYNELTDLHPFGKNVNLTKLYLDHNQITEIPGQQEDDGYSYFCGYKDVESFTFTYNQLTEVPDVFNAKSVYVMQAVDFSHNQITGFENGDEHHGINASTITLSYNKLSAFPKVLFKKNSPISTLMLSSNGLKEIKKGDLQGEKANYLSVLDLTFNKLSKLPDDFRATTLPYLTQMDISFNCFSKFPIEPLNVSSLVSFAIRHQRDEKGNRTLREWPTGLYTCPSLQRFYIGSNDLRKIDDTISPNIFIFEIKDNPNISIDLTKVCPYIQAGAYLLIYDETQDIRGCDALDLE